MAGCSRSPSSGRRATLGSAGVVLAPRVGADFTPRALRAVLPKAFIHHAEPAGAIDRFFAAWEAAWQRARGRALTPRQRFVAAALGLADRHGYALDRRDALLRRGFLWLGPPLARAALTGVAVRSRDVGRGSSARSRRRSSSATVHIRSPRSVMRTGAQSSAK